MLQHTNSVLVGKFPTAFTNIDALNVGEIAMFDGDGKLLTNVAGVQAAKKVRFGLVESKVDVDLPNGTISPRNSIVYSQFIDKARIKTPSLTVVPYKAPVEESYTINFAGVTVTEDARYAIRFIYFDLSHHKFQVTKTYDFFAITGTTPAQLAAALGRAINRDPSRRITATVAGTTITVNARIVDDNEGLNSINEYSQVRMDMHVFKTTVSTFMYYKQITPTGLVVTKVTSVDPGNGNPKIVRDRERTALAYRGATNRVYFPGNIKYPELNTDLSKTYDTLVIEWESLYRSPDNQYIKNTPLATEIYFEAGSASAAIKNMFLAISADYVTPVNP